MLAIGSDHAAFSFKEEIKKYLDEKGIEYKDFGCYSEESTDYPIYGEAVQGSQWSMMGYFDVWHRCGYIPAANKVKGIRAVVCSDCYSAALSKRHNNTNILALGAREGIDLQR